MAITHCLLHCASDFIPAVHPLLACAKFHLLTASRLGKEYEKTWHSIIWIKSRAATKRRVSEQLNHLAFDCYSHFLDATEYLNEYAQLMNEIRVSEPWWWPTLWAKLEGIDEMFHREHDNEIYWRQLQLVC
jgi:hypothetical protein